MRASLILTWSFLGVVALAVALILCGVALVTQRAQGNVSRALFGTGAVLTLLLGTSGALARAGAFASFAPPPKLMLFVGAVGLSTVALGFSPLGRRVATQLPLAFLIGISAFRFPLELVMHQAAAERVMPRVMSYSGWNFDILTGMSAALIALNFAARGVPLWLAALWNAAGFALLCIVVSIAIMATPLFHMFPRDFPNTWITHVPFVWLPTFLVPLALLSHILVLRHLLARWRKPASHS